VKHSDEPTGDVRFCLVFPREALSIPVMRRVLGDTLIRLGVDENDVADLLLAVTEACTNVLRHAGGSRRYEVVAEVGRNRCQVEVVDSGRGFDPAKVAEPSAGVRRRPPGRPEARPRRRRQAPAWHSPALPAPMPLLGRLARGRRTATDRAIAELPESGRGLAIMRACVDDVTLRGGPGTGTVVSLRKRIEWRDDAPLTHLSAWQLRDAG
jgi:serine/threonine-protein kinase RsbW